MKKGIEAYFTVEAAMVLPMVLLAIVLIIYLQFFQYNRCLMEQDIGILALQGVILQAEDNEDRMEQLQEQAAGLDAGKYIAWDGGEIILRIEKGKLYAEQSGEIKFPFRGAIFKGNQVWAMTTAYENRIVSPVSFIRSYRKISGGK